MKYNQSTNERDSSGGPAPFRAVDLNLFRAFAAVMRTRSVTAAGRELGVTASAVSHALSRLRRALRDELFIAGDAGMEPTPRALELAPDIHDGIARLEAALSGPVFDPARSLRTFRIAATDFTGTVILPRLAGRVARRALQASLHVFPANRIDVIAGLEHGRLDLVLGWFGTVTDAVRRMTIMTETEAFVARTDHPMAGRRVSAAELLRFPQIVVELTGDAEKLDDGFINERGVLRRTWIERVVMEQKEGGTAGRVAIIVPHYAALPPMLQRSDMVATLPQRLAAPAIARGELAELDVDCEKIVVNVEALWHRRAEHDPGAQWLISELLEAMEEG